jgi:DnaK suppressor protein
MHDTRRPSLSDQRHFELKHMLEERQRDLIGDLQQRVRQVGSPESVAPSSDVVDSAEMAEADVQDELRLSLIQMKAEMLERVKEALVRLDAGTFGICEDCGRKIAERRLRALPFALRCIECEEDRETAENAARGTRKFGTMFGTDSGDGL